MAKVSKFGSLTWSFLGPTNVSGRANDVAVSYRNGQRRIYVGYAGSGLWASDDHGTTWTPLFRQAASTAVVAVAVAPSKPDVVWLLTGNPNRAHLRVAGAGIFKSLNAGRTWQAMGLPNVGNWIGRIVVHPTNPDVVFVASLGGPSSNSKERGIYKTTNGGRTWTQIFERGASVGVRDLIMSPGDPETLYATTGRRPRGNEPRVVWTADEVASVFRSVDSGAHWTEIATGLPEARFRGAIGIDLARSNPNVLYAVVNNSEVVAPPAPGERDVLGVAPWPNRAKGPEVYRTDDRGSTWRLVSRHDDVALRPSSPSDYATEAIRVDPKDVNTVYALGVQLVVSHDAGTTFQRVRASHVDHTAMWIDPRQRIVYDCNDGGLAISTDGGTTWTRTVVPTSQFYNVELDMAVPFRVYGSVQDQYSYRRSVPLENGRDTLEAAAFDIAPGSETTSHAADPTNPAILYTSRSLMGNDLVRVDLSRPLIGRFTSIRPIARPDDPALRGPRFLSIVLSPHDSQTVYVGYQALFRSTDRGDHWERISTDLSNGPPEMRRPDFVNQAISTIAESPRKAGLIYAGTDDGRLHVTTDGGKKWTDLTPHLASSGWISGLVASRSADGTVYVGQSGRENDDFAPHLYKSTDYGMTFTSIVANLPAGPVNVIREDPSIPGTLYAGTDFGVYVSTSGGSKWDVVGSNLPAVPVTDIQIHPRDRMIVISTWGAGLWALDANRVAASVPSGRREARR